ncbi:hypothetical protein CR513_35676, partial [Mucuna pruriens]
MATLLGIKHVGTSKALESDGCVVTSPLEVISRRLVTITQPGCDLSRDIHTLGFNPLYGRCPKNVLSSGGQRKAKLSAYMTRSKSKAMENKIEAFELQNRDLKGYVSQLKE